MKRLLQVLGVIVMLFGLLFALQGAGIVMWPASSFMLQQTEWILYGLVVFGVGLMLFGFGSRRRR